MTTTIQTFKVGSFDDRLLIVPVIPDATYSPEVKMFFSALLPHTVRAHVAKSMEISVCNALQGFAAPFARLFSIHSGGVDLYPVSDVSGGVMCHVLCDDSGLYTLKLTATDVEMSQGEDGCLESTLLPVTSRHQLR